MKCLLGFVLEGEFGIDKSNSEFFDLINALTSDSVKHFFHVIEEISSVYEKGKGIKGPKKLPRNVQDIIGKGLIHTITYMFRTGESEEKIKEFLDKKYPGAETVLKTLLNEISSSSVGDYMNIQDWINEFATRYLFKILHIDKEFSSAELCASRESFISDLFEFARDVLIEYLRKKI